MRKVLLKKTLVLGILVFVTGNILSAMNANPFFNSSSAQSGNWMVGLFYHANGVSSNFIARNYNDCILNVTGGTDFKVTQDASNWNVITQTGGVTVDYTYATGIYFTGIQFGEYYKALAPNTIPETTDYSVEMKIQFASGWAHAGFEFNYVDADNFGSFNAIYERSGEGGIRLMNVVDGVATQDLVKMDLSPTEYILKVDVNNTNGVLNGYLNGNLVCSLSILPVPPTEVYVDDDYSSATPGWGYDHFSSIQDGIDAVDVGGTVYVKSGFYTETLNPHSHYVLINKSLSLIGEKAESTKINCPSGETGIAIGWPEDYSNINISGFSVVGAYNPVSIGIYPQLNNHNIRIEDCIVYGFGEGISIRGGSTNIIIRNCIVYDNNRVGGITFQETGYQNIIISKCSTYNNFNGIKINDVMQFNINNISAYENDAAGIVIENSEQGTVANCNCENNTDDGISINYNSNHNTIINNYFAYNVDDGIQIYSSNENELINNKIIKNIETGIVIIENSNNNTLYHNNIIDNALQANDLCSNFWDDGYPSGGNFWSDYTGIDANSDGIGDTPYNIPGGSNHDSYPFTEQDGWLNPPPPNQLPVAEAGGPYYANVGNSITFSGSGSSDTDGTIVGYRWDWTNDGTCDTDWLPSATTTHSYLSAGTFTVKLEVKDNVGGTHTDTATAYITTEGGAVPTADVNGPYSGYVSHPAIFSSAGSIGGSEGMITEYYWTFGDGTVSNQQNPSHTYNSAGTFTVTLKVTNNFGQTDTDTTSATIAELSPEQILPVANAGGPYTGVVNSLITFNGSGSIDADGTIVSYLWNFGDGITGTGVSPTHTYTIAGNYTVILTVTDNQSLTHSNSTTANINVSGPPTIVISIDISNIEPIEEENEKTIPVTVFCYHQSVSNIHLEILESSNLTVTFLSPNITLNPGESRELLISVKAPKLDIKGDERVGDETIILKAVGDGNVTSNTEQINIKVIEKGATPGFELVFALCAIAVALFFWRKKKTI